MKNRIQELRKEDRIMQEELAARCKVTRQTAFRIADYRGHSLSMLRYVLRKEILEMTYKASNSRQLKNSTTG